MRRDSARGSAALAAQRTSASPRAYSTLRGWRLLLSSICSLCVSLLWRRAAAPTAALRKPGSQISGRYHLSNQPAAVLALAGDRAGEIARRDLKSCIPIQRQRFSSHVTPPV